MRCVLRFATHSGPLRGRCLRDLRLCAALICCQAAYHTVYPGYWMCNSIRKLNSWANCPTDLIHYNKALSMAEFICDRSYGTEDPSLPRLQPQDIMNVDIYHTVRQMARDMQIHGVSSDKAQNVGNSNDILDGVYFPTFLCIDKLLRKRDWGNICPRDKLWISTEEEKLYQDNLPLLEGIRDPYNSQVTQGQPFSRFTTLQFLQTVCFVVRFSLSSHVALSFTQFDCP